MHDFGEKTVLGHKIPAGGGEQDGLQVIDILAHHPSTAKFISRELAQRFVADDPPQALVDRMAQTFTKTDGDLRAVLETMFTSPEFFSEGAWQAKVKSPFEMVVSAVRAMGAEVSDTFTLVQKIADLGEPLYNKLEPNGYPNTGDAWLSTVGLMGRMNFSAALASGLIPGVKLDPARLAGKDAPAIARDLLGRDASPQTQARWRRVSKAKTERRHLSHRWCSVRPISRGGNTTMLTRRIFLRGSAVVMAGMGAVPSWLARAAVRRRQETQDPGGDFPARRGGWPEHRRAFCARSDTASCGPRSPSRRPAGRPTQWPNNGPFNGSAIDLDGRFALNGAMQPLKALWDKQQLAIVEATGSPDSSRSHFDAQDYMESGTPGKSTGDGWLNRALPPAGRGHVAVAGRRDGQAGSRARFAANVRPSPSAIPSSSTWAIRTPPRSWRTCTATPPTRSGGAPARTRSKP